MQTKNEWKCLKYLLFLMSLSVSTFFWDISKMFLLVFLIYWWYSCIKFSLMQILSRLKPLRLYFTFWIVKICIFEGHYLKRQFLSNLLETFFKGISKIWLFIIINIDKIKTTKKLHVLHVNSKNSYFKRSLFETTIFQ